MNQKEFQSSAAWEGWAQFVAAVAFNDDTQADCAFFYYKVTDWDLNGTNDVLLTNCDGAPMTGVPGADYLGGMCSGTLANRGTEYDWLRFWWDLRTDQGVSPGTIGDIWDDADPHNWRPTDVGTAPLPSTRLRNAASTNGVLTEWDAEDNTNGVHR